MRPTWTEIDLSAIRHNLQEIRRVTHPAASIMAVVKANAYGHGVLPVASIALANGANSLAIALPEEGVHLRQHGISAPILIMARPLNAKGINAFTAKLDVRFRNAANIGEKLLARGELLSHRGRMYEMKAVVTRENGETVAEATGTFMAMK